MGRWVDLGGIEARGLIVDRFKLDGGAMFGQVPKPLWNRYTKVDEMNRIPLVTRALLLRVGSALALVDAGTGSDYPPEQMHYLEIESREGGLQGALKAAGVDPDDVEHLIITHLHFDHVAGVGVPNGSGVARPAVPRARVYVQRSQWDRARAPGPKEQDSFRPQDLTMLESMDLQLIDREAEILPGIFVRRSDGHTRGLQLVIAHGRSDHLYYPSDLIPTLAHIHSAFTMGFDMWPERLVEEKLTLLAEVAETDGLLVFAHDPDTAACRVRSGPRGFAVRRKEII